jgi:hypothetical protein
VRLIDLTGDHRATADVGVPLTSRGRKGKEEIAGLGQFSSWAVAASWAGSGWLRERGDEGLGHPRYWARPKRRRVSSSFPFSKNPLYDETCKICN